MLAVLVVAGIYVPRSNWTHAKSPDAGSPDARSTAAEPASADNAVSQSPANQNTVNQSPDMAAPSAAPASPAGSPMNSNSTPAAPTPPSASVDNSNAMQPQQMPPSVPMGKSGSAHAHAKKLMAQDAGNGSAGADAMQGGAAMGSPAAGDSAQFDELEKTVDQLSNRAAAVNSGLDHLQQQQAASGYGLRADMVERQASLKSNLFKAEEALQHRDAARAKKYADLAEADAEVLERFLGH